MTKRQIDKNWQKLLASGEVTHNKKKKKPIEYEKRTKDGKKVLEEISNVTFEMSL